MALTRLERTGDGATTVYTVSFPMGFAQSDIYVSLDTEYYIDQLDYTWINSTQIQMSTPVGAGIKFNIRRVVQKNSPINDYEQGAILRENNLDNSFAQPLQILQEYGEGFKNAGYSEKQNLDLGTHRITNLAPSESTTDAINKGELVAQVISDTNRYIAQEAAHASRFNTQASFTAMRFSDQVLVQAGVDNIQDSRLTAVEGSVATGSRYIHWLYNNGVAIGGELILNIPYTFNTISTVYINGVRMTQGLAFDYDANAKTVEFAEELVEGDEVVVALGTEALDTNEAFVADTAQAFIFETVEAYKASSIVFPVGKTIHLNDRGADFKVVTGNTTTLDYNIIFSTVVAQSIDLIISDVLLPKQWGASADGDEASPTDDTLVLQAVLEHSKSTGIRIESDSAHNYFLGTFPDDATVVKFELDVNGTRWDTNNCKFSAIASIALYHDGLTSQIVFRISASDITIGDYEVIADKIAKAGSERQGIHAINIYNDITSGNTRNISLGTVKGTRLISVITGVNTDAELYRCRGITFKRLFNDDGYYVLNLANNGDNVAGVVASNSCVRTYFCYGVDDHEVNVQSSNHQKFSDCVISRFSRDTKNIDINYNCTSSVTSSGLISFEHINDDADARISNVSIKYGAKLSNAANPTINFKSFTAAGAVETTTTKAFDEITLTGETNSVTPISLSTSVVGANQSIVHTNASSMRFIKDTKGFVFILGMDRVAESNIAGGMSLKFNLANSAFVGNYAKLSLWAADNGNGAGSEYTIREYYIYYSMTGAGAVNIVSTQLQPNDFSGGSIAPTILFPTQSDGSYSLIVNVSGYTGANAIVRARLSLMSSQQFM